MDRTNLNPWYAVLWRRSIRSIRRLLYSFDSPFRRRLYDQKREIAIKEVLTDAERKELARLNWKLGNGSVYRLTPMQREERAKLAQAIIANIRRKERGQN